MTQYFAYTQEDIENLKKRDARLAKHINNIGDIQVPVKPDLFIALVYSIVGQQISIKAHATIWKRFVTKLENIACKNEQECLISVTQKAEKNVNVHTENELNPYVVKPEHLLLLSEEEIQSCGMTFKKAQNILDFAQKIHNKSFDLQALTKLSDKEVITQLSSLKGVGKWTAEMMMLFSMQRPDILSLGDLGIQKGLCLVFNKEKISKEDGVYFQEKFSPYGSLASLYLWKIVGLGIK